MSDLVCHCESCGKSGTAMCEACRNACDCKPCVLRRQIAAGQIVEPVTQPIELVDLQVLEEHGPIPLFAFDMSDIGGES